ncbi:hypothetical protein ACA910_001141 [Epithemia clementina (nom. ined.)]
MDTIEEKLPPLVALYCNEHSLDLSQLPPLGFAFKAQPFDEESDGSFQSYVSSCSTIYSAASEGHSADESAFDQPPRGSAPIPQAWSTPLPPSVAHASPATVTEDSPISQEAFDRVTRDNERLSRQISVLTDQVQQLLSAQKRQNTVPPPPPVATRDIDVEQIVLATTKSVLAALQHHFPMPVSTGHSASHSPSTGLEAGRSSTRPTEMDTSFDSTTLGTHDASA